MIDTLLFYIIILIYLIIKNKKIIIKDSKTLNKKNNIVTLKIFIIGMILFLLSNYIINYIIIPNGISTNELNNRKLLYNNIIIYSLLFGLIIPIVEELIFRLTIKKYIKNNTIFLLISSTLFALLHLVSSTKLIEILYFIPYFILGYIFSYSYIKTKNIYYPILCHITNNIITLVVILLLK